MADSKTERTIGKALPLDVPSSQEGGYVVVARRYRPQTFDELVGQQHVARALKGAIAANRVGHAYLFTGARGVGKTSAARILAKALNCVNGPTATPCNQCDICRSISAGSDVDVLEIDGASNRGIDEIRQLRQNVSIRPSRARHKIYIIDEVHMLTREAFNALLKTLEEPPEHVKFIFCTTEATKIPVTILSRCQRFDFAGIGLSAIVERLRQIVESEGVAADPEALAILARRAAGSMRDSQSLLEQLLAFGQQQITAADVHAMLGTAGESRLAQLGELLVAHDAAGAIAALDAALAQGVDVGQLLEQLLGYFRDLLACTVGCSSDVLLNTSAGEQDRLAETGRQLGAETILAIMQILDQTLARLRYSTQARTLAEMALVRIAKLENLDSISELIGQLRGDPAGLAGAGGKPAPSAANSSPPALAAPAKKKELNGHEPATRSEGSTGLEVRSESALTDEVLGTLWKEALATLPGLLGERAALSNRVALRDPNRVVVTFCKTYTVHKDFCERPDQLGKLQEALEQVAGRPLRVEFVLADDPVEVAPSEQPSAGRSRPIGDHPLVRRAAELFDARLVRVEEASAGRRE
jgi:DNA polymerase III subunit gamma/tau